MTAQIIQFPKNYCDVVYYTVSTRNWYGTDIGKKLLDATLKMPGMIVYRNAAGDNDDKYVFQTCNKADALGMKDVFENVREYTGGSVYFDDVTCNDFDRINKQFN